MYRTAQLIGSSETPEGSMGNDGFSPGGQGTVGVGKQCTVLFGEEKSRSDGVYANAVSEFGRHLYRHVFGKLLYGGFGRSITYYPGKGA